MEHLFINTGYSVKTKFILVKSIEKAPTDLVSACTLVYKNFEVQ